MTYYPIVIPTLNRFEHFKRCVESLAKCTNADQTELVIGVDYPPLEKYRDGYEKVKAYASTIRGFKKVTIFEHPKNLGASNNILQLRAYCREHYDACISTEDDNVFAPCFIDYMAKAFEYFRDDMRVVSICAYSSEACVGNHANTPFLTYDNCVWGFGVWFAKEKEISAEMDHPLWSERVLRNGWKMLKVALCYPACLGMFMDMVKSHAVWGDVRRTVYNIVNKKYQIRPGMSLARNTGYDGTGIHCGIDEDNSHDRQQISSDLFYGGDLGSARILNGHLWCQCGPSASRFTYLKNLFIRYCCYRSETVFYRLILRLGCGFSRIVKLYSPASRNQK